MQISWVYELKLVQVSKTYLEVRREEKSLPLAKPHGVGVGGEKRHAAGTSGVSLRLATLVSQRADRLSQKSERPDYEGKKARALSCRLLRLR